MLKVNCDACGAPYEVDPRRVPASGLKMRCPACGASVNVDPPGQAAPLLDDLDLDLPAPKASPGGNKFKGTAMGLGMPSGQAAAKIAPPLEGFAAPQTGALADFGDIDLPAPKGSAPKPAPALDLDDLPAPKGAVPKLDMKPNKAPASLDLDDLPAPKPMVSKPGAFKPASPKPAATLNTGAQIPDLDLPAPKAAAKPAGRIAPSFDAQSDFDAPSSTMPALSGGFDGLDLPTPAGNVDLPAPAKGFTDLPAPAQGGVDLPAPARGFADLPAPSKGMADLPAKKPAAAAKAPELDLGGFDLDLPAPKPRAGGASAGRAAPARAPVATGARANSLPKDSLAIDPAPFFAKSPQAAGPLSDLDDFGDNGPNVDLPTPSALRDLPAPKSGRGNTSLGLGQKLAKDSLDVPGARDEFGGIEISGSPFLDEEDLPAPADLPVVRGPNVPDFDLPAPGDLPVVKPHGGGGVDLPAPADLPKFKADGSPIVDLPAHGDLPRRSVPQTQGTNMGIGPMLLDQSLDLPPQKPANQAGFGDFDLPPARPKAGMNNTFGSLDLPPPSRANPDQSQSVIDLGDLSLPSPEPKRNKFGGTMDLSSDDLELPGGNVLQLPTVDRATGGLPLPSMGDLDLFGDSTAQQKPRAQTIELDGMFELGSSVAVENVPRGKRGAPPPTQDFGELDFGLSGTDAQVARPQAPMPIPIPAQGAPGAFESAEAELLGSAPEAPAKKKKKKKKEGSAKAIPAWIWPIVVLLVIAGTGVGLGLFSEHGYFGMYFVERLVAAGDPVRVGAAIELAEKQGKSDTYVDVRKSLVTLSDARNEAGLNRELLARSLLHEALYQLRFGDDAQSSQRSVAILSRLTERGGDVAGLPLAEAADTARRGDIAAASTKLKALPADKDPYHQLVVGEVAMLEKKYDVALKAFTSAETQGAGARGRWGKARALRALEKTAEAEAAAKATLELSPRHSGALVLLAEVALDRGDEEAAIEATRKATGGLKIDGTAARPSKVDMTRAWALMGKIEEKLDHPKEAQAAYERALAADPLRVDVLIGSGRMLMRLGRPLDALSRFDSAVSAKAPNKPDVEGRIPLVEASTGAAQALLALMRPQEALTRVDAAKEFADHPLITLWRGHCLTALEKWEDAEAAFKTTIEKAPESFAGYVALSQLLFKRDRPEEASRVLNDATGKVKDSAEVRRMLGQSELTRHHLPEAIHQFEAALRFDPRDPGSLYGLVLAQRKTGRIDDAEKALSKLQKADPTYPNLANEQGLLLEIRGKYDEAVKVYRAALAERPTDTDLKLRLGAALVTSGVIDEADEILKQVLKERPSSAEAEHFAGRVLFARKDTAQAVQRFQRAVSFDNTVAEYHLYLAWAFLEQGNLSGALDSVEKALERDPNLGDAHWVLGRVQLRTGAVKDALASFQLARKLKPGRIEALAGMGDAYDELRQLPQAIEAYREATRAQPENGELWYRLGNLHNDKGNLDEARVALQEAVLRGDRLIEKPRWLADAHRLYADLLRQGGRTAEAVDHYKTFLTLAPADHPSRTEVTEIVRSSGR